MKTTESKQELTHPRLTEKVVVRMWQFIMAILVLIILFAFFWGVH